MSKGLKELSIIRVAKKYHRVVNMIDLYKGFYIEEVSRLEKIKKELEVECKLHKLNINEVLDKYKTNEKLSG